MTVAILGSIFHFLPLLFSFAFSSAVLISFIFILSNTIEVQFVLLFPLPFFSLTIIVIFRSFPAVSQSMCPRYLIFFLITDCRSSGFSISILQLANCRMASIQWYFQDSMPASFCHIFADVISLLSFQSILTWNCKMPYNFSGVVRQQCFFKKKTDFWAASGQRFFDRHSKTRCCRGSGQYKGHFRLAIRVFFWETVVDFQSIDY